MIVEYLTNLADFLNMNGYHVTESQISRFLEAQEVEVGIESSADFESQLKVFFCNNQSEYHCFHDVYKEFTKRERYTDRISELKRQKEEYKKTTEKNRDDAAKSMEKIDEDIHAVEEEIEEKKNKTMSNITKKTKEDLQKTTSQLPKKVLPNDIQEVVGHMIKERECSFADNEKLENFVKQIPGLCRKALEKGDMPRFTALKDLHDTLEKFCKKTRKSLSTEEEENRLQKLRRKKSQMEKDAEKIERLHIQTQKKIDDEIKKLVDRRQNGQQVLKDHVENHRQNYQNGSRAVRSSAMPDYAKNTFNSLTPDQKKNIYHYIRKNAVAFKTRLGRYLRNGLNPKVDMQETIQQACRYGIPLNIVMQRQKRTRPNLVLILDVSGSCKHASQMMIMFMHALKEVFPGGCKVYAFTNVLYDISEALDLHDAEEAVTTVLNNIPRSGAYSNYYIPLKDIWENHAKDLKKDSMIIFMGDARNNKNKSGEEYIRNIVRKSGGKRAYWLNTDEKGKWDQGDSIASVYEKYTQMLEVRTPKQLLQFISSL